MIAAVFLSSVAFALVHLPQMMLGVNRLVIGASPFLTGLVLGTVVVLTKRLGAAIFAHMAVNGIALLVAVLTDLP